MWVIGPNGTGLQRLNGAFLSRITRRGDPSHLETRDRQPTFR